MPISDTSPGLGVLPALPSPQRKAWRRVGQVLAACLALALPTAAAAEQTATLCPTAGAPGTHLYVTVSGARRVAGNVTFTVYGEDKTRFLAHRGSLLVARVTLTGPTAEACFAVSAPGTYAVAVYHDENDNHHFDRNFLGLPAEGYGFTNDAPLRLGPPSFDAAKIAVHDGDNRFSIQLRY